MAKKSKIARNKQREILVTKYAERRAELKAKIKDLNTSFEDKMAARDELNKLPRDSSPVRVRNRDSLNGRPRGFVGLAGISRVTFRKMAHRGELPGVTKSSW